MSRSQGAPTANLLPSIDGTANALGMHSAITNEQLEAVRQAVLQGESFLGYAELAKRMGVSERTAREMVSVGKITPIISGHRTARFHWPSVVAQLQKIT